MTLITKESIWHAPSTVIDDPLYHAFEHTGTTDTNMLVYKSACGDHVIHTKRRLSSTATRGSRKCSKCRVEVEQGEDMENYKREPVDWFSDRMEDKLREHDEERGEASWRSHSSTVDGLFEHLKEEVRELETALEDGAAASAMALIHECADVANMAMMIADRIRVYRILQKPDEATDDNRTC